MKLFSKKVMGLCLLLIGFAVNAKEYYIQGTLTGAFKEDGEYEPKLHNPIGHGIDFFHESVMIGKKGKVQYSFRFRNATTDCPEGFVKGLKFYRNENGKWQEDSEVGQGSATFRSDRTMAIVLVLDCSSSLKDQIDIVQESAKEFISLLAERTENRGNIHVGIVAFNYRQIVSDIVPLTASNMVRLMHFIDGLETIVNNNTALYGSIDNGVAMLEDYVLQNNLENFDGAVLVAFTDGLDNASLNAEKNIITPSQYLEYLKPLVNSKQIKGTKLNSYVVAVKGRDVHDDVTFNENLKPLATSENNYFLLDDMTWLKQKFRFIADGLVTRWMDLICYIPPVGQGEVRWVLECGSEPAPIIVDRPEPKKKVISEIGGIVGGINGFSSKFINRKFAYQLDLGVKCFVVNDYYYSGSNYYEYSDLACVLDLTQNFMYQNYIHEWKNSSLFWFVGGGVNFGWNLSMQGLKCGINSIGGVEYRFNKIPLALQGDFRPGYGYLFDERINLFEWTIGLSARYYF